MSTNTQQQIKEIQEDMNQLKNGIESQLDKKLNDALNHKSISDIANDAGKNINRFFTKQKENAAHAKDSAESTLKAHPFASTLVAFGSGLLIAALLKRK